MKITQKVRKILANYESDNPGTKANLARILMEGKLGGSGKLVILPVDQGFEHGPARSFAPNPDAYDPHYHYELAIDAGLSAYAAPLGMLEAGAATFAGEIPLILKMNSNNSLSARKDDADQAVTGSIDDALRLGCSAIGFTIYPGSDAVLDAFTDSDLGLGGTNLRGYILGFTYGLYRNSTIGVRYLAAENIDTVSETAVPGTRA